MWRHESKGAFHLLYMLMETIKKKIFIREIERLMVSKFQNEFIEVIVSPKLWTKNCQDFCPVVCFTKTCKKKGLYTSHFQMTWKYPRRDAKLLACFSNQAHLSFTNCSYWTHKIFFFLKKNTLELYAYFPMCGEHPVAYNDYNHYYARRSQLTSTHYLPT